MYTGLSDGPFPGSFSETSDRSTRFQFVVLSPIAMLWRKEKGGGCLSTVEMQGYKNLY